MHRGADRPVLRLALTGDSIVTRRISVQRDEPTRRLVELIRNADVAFTNLEVLPNDFRGYPAVESGGTHLAAAPWALDELLAMGFDLFACANNHSLDYSIEGLLATIDVLERRGVAFAGIGRNLAEARMPIYQDCGAGSVALVACASTFAPGQEAGEQRPDLGGRPGLNPLRFETTYDVTPDQLETLRRVSDGLGLDRERLEKIQLGFAFPPDDPEVFPFLGASFRAGDRLGITTVPKMRDREAIGAWIRDARARADVVVASLHAHEQGATKEEPAEFIRTFAHDAIEQGADVVVGHGPHLLRGLELYRGKPIFYSLGNFVGQNELVAMLPADAYERFRIDPAETPSRLFRIRSQDDARSFPADGRYWQCVLPFVTFEADRPRDIEIVPITLGLGQALHRRGRPRLATGGEAREILDRLARLSQPFGTDLAVEGERGIVALG